MKKITILTSVLLLWTAITYAQVGINTDGSPPDNTAMLDVKSNNKGMLIPRMTQADILAIVNPADGLQVYNTDDSKIYIFVLSQGKWREVQYDNTEIALPASYTIGTGGSCANTSVNGSYYNGITLNSNNTIDIEVNVTIPGSWSITTNTVNGYSFSGSGTFTTTAHRFQYKPIPLRLRQVIAEALAPLM